MPGDTLPPPPVAARRPHTWNRPTGPVTDEWAWLADRDDPAVIAHLEAENAWAEQWFGTRGSLIDDLFGEIKSRVKEDDDAVPVRRGAWWYTSRTVTGLAYQVHTRGTSRETATENVILDENAEADGHGYFSLNIFDVSNDDATLAWSGDTDGSELYTVRFRDIATGTDAPEEIPGTTWGGSAWSTDGSVFFYVVPDAAMRPWRVMRHRMGTPHTADEVVFEEPDERFFVSVELTKSRRWIVLESSSRTSSESYLLRADDPLSAPRSVRPRRDDVEYSIDHWGDRFVVVHNEGALDFRVDTAAEDSPGNWHPLVGHVAGARITAFECFAGWAAMQRWVAGQQVISVVRHDGSSVDVHVLDEPHEVEIDANPEFGAASLRISYQSLTTPPTVAEVDARSLDLTVLKRTETPNVDLSAYVSERLWATADDGTPVPFDIVRRGSTALDGTAPCLVYGYGSYEASMPPWFSVARLSLLDRGFVWALAHPRGGGEMGRSWYLEGRLLAKRNTFTDTLAVVHRLGDGIVDPARVVVRGGSAGGLLVGACITMEPSAFAGAVAEVPFVDIVNTMSDPTLPLTVTEWEEWGDPRSEPWASYMLGYSPYDNTVAVKYPDLYVTAGLNDPRVSYHEPAKWVARLRAVSPGTLVVFRCEMGAGHGGPSGRYDRWHDEARTLAFVVSAAG
ncbi:MAG: S9 family peptidase [Ilumatobacteraceae bacterium]